MKKFLLVIFFGLIGLFFSFSFVSASSWKSFTIWKYLDWNTIIVQDNYNNSFVIDYDYGCNIYSWNEGGHVYIDTYLYPSFYNGMVFNGSSCKITNFPKKLNLYPLYVKDVDTLDRYIIADNSNGDTYIVDYGYGCYSMNSFKYKYIYVDSYSGRLSKFNKLYLFSGYSEQSCSIFDVKVAHSDQRYYNYDTESPKPPVIKKTKKKINKIKKKVKSVTISSIVIGKKSVKIRWKKVYKKKARYIIQLWKKNKKIRTIKTTKNKKRIKRLKFNTKYKYRMRIKKASRRGSWASWQEFKTKK